MRRLALVPLLAVALAGCGDDKKEENAPVIGKWKGTLEQAGQPNFVATADVKTLDTGNSDTNTVSYTGINCSGHWTFQSKETVADTTSYKFHEKIDSGEGGKCKGEGTVILTPGPDGLGYVFAGGGVSSTGILKKQ